MNASLIVGIICLLIAVALGGVAGLYASTNAVAALGVAFAACIALILGVRWFAQSN